MNVEELSSSTDTTIATIKYVTNTHEFATSQYAHDTVIKKINTGIDKWTHYASLTKKSELLISFHAPNKNDEKKNTKTFYHICLMSSKEKIFQLSLIS
jgi:hypothetical protein